MVLLHFNNVPNILDKFCVAWILHYPFECHKSQCLVNLCGHSAVPRDTVLGPCSVSGSRLDHKDWLKHLSIICDQEFDDTLKSNGTCHKIVTLLTVTVTQSSAGRCMRSCMHAFVHACMLGNKVKTWNGIEKWMNGWKEEWTRREIGRLVRNEDGQMDG